MTTIICNNYNKSLLDKTILEDLKTAEFMPVYKKKKCTNKNNYKIVKFLSTIKFMTILTEFFRIINVDFLL